MLIINDIANKNFKNYFNKYTIYEEIYLMKNEKTGMKVILVFLLSYLLTLYLC